MDKQALDYYMDMPREMKSYLRHHGWHFTKRACEVAVSMMRRMNAATGKVEKVEMMSKDEVEDLLKRNNVVLENCEGYDHVYIANMIKADRWKSSIEDEKHLALAIKDEVDDIDQANGFIFARWYSDMIRKDKHVDWEEIL